MALRKKRLPKWVQGRIPHHVKRMSVSNEDAVRLAKLGQKLIYKFFKVKLYFMQALIAGAMLSGEFDEFTIVTPSQYGKSWLLARVALIRAYMGNVIYVAGARRDTTDIIMRHMSAAVLTSCAEMRDALVETKSQLDRLNKSLSKTRISFQGRGSVESITLGDTYSGLVQNSAIGRGGDYIVDEAALISDDALAELGRVDFAKINGEKCQLCMISNPHKPGVFYDSLTQDNPGKRTFILWIDALTAVEEERFTEDDVINGKFSNNRSTMRRYLLCELDANGDSMFGTAKTYAKKLMDVQYRFLGVDAAYKGKDDLCVALVSITSDGKMHVEEVEKLDKSNWIEGVTNHQIIREVTAMARGSVASLTCVDKGFGLWLIQGLEDNGVNVLGINFQSKPTRARVEANQYAAKEAYNVRAEMHLDLQDLIEDDAIDFEVDAYEKVKDVFPFVLCDRKANGLIQVRPKPEIKKSIGRSPNELDAVLLAVHAAIVFFGERRRFIA